MTPHCKCICDSGTGKLWAELCAELCAKLRAELRAEL